MSSQKHCFVICPIGEAGSETRRRADKILKHIIAPAVRSLGYEPLRADQISEPGLITSQIIQHIVDDPLLIADLTGTNPNVFYELAIRHAIRKPLVQIIQKGEKIPFDVAGMRTIPVDHTDLDSVDEAKAEIQKQISAVQGKAPKEIESPISVSLELQALRHSDRPQDRTLAEFLSVVGQLRAEIGGMDKKVSESLAMQQLVTKSLNDLDSDRKQQLLKREAMAQDMEVKAAVRRKELELEQKSLISQLDRILNDLRKVRTLKDATHVNEQLGKVEQGLQRVVVMLAVNTNPERARSLAEKYFDRATQMGLRPAVVSRESDGSFKMIVGNYTLPQALEALRDEAAAEGIQLSLQAG